MKSNIMGLAVMSCFNAVPLRKIRELLETLMDLDAAVKRRGFAGGY